MKYRVQNIVNNEYLDDDSIFLLPNGEVGWFIRDGSYPHYRKFGHQEDFKVINEDCERLQKQLDIAVECLKTTVNLACPYFKVKTAKSDSFHQLKNIQKKCGIALQQIKELNK